MENQYSKDRNWMYKPKNRFDRRQDNDFLEGVEYFIKFALSSTTEMEMPCPCMKCENKIYKDHNIVKEHLICYGFFPHYSLWTYHGEPFQHEKTTKTSILRQLEKERPSGRANAHSEIHASQMRNEVHVEIHAHSSPMCNAHASPLRNEVLDSPMESMDEALFKQQIEDANTSHMKKRRTRGWITLKVVAPINGKKHKCFVQKDGKIVGPGRHNLSFKLGILARSSLFPIYKKWGKEHESSIGRVMVDVHRDFEFLNPDGIEVSSYDDVINFVKRTINQQIRDFRSMLKEKLDPHIPISEQLERLDSRVSQKSWVLLIKYWCEEAKMLEASRNKKNHSALQSTHTSGPISFAERQYEAGGKGQEVSLLDNYLNGHKRTNGDYPNEKTKECCEKVKQMCNELGVESTKYPLEFISALDDVFGSHHGGYERGFGGGITQISLKKKALLNESNRATTTTLKSQLKEKDREIEERDRVIETLRAQLQQYQSQGTSACLNFVRRPTSESLDEDHDSHVHVQRLFNEDGADLPSTSGHAFHLSTHFGSSRRRIRALGPTISP